MAVHKRKYFGHVKTSKNRLNLQKFVELEPALVYNDKENRLIVLSSADFPLLRPRMDDIVYKIREKIKKVVHQWVKN